ncbi:hypothetical protein BT69DRAFT_1328329 [Atractiella rhizophila]|nr:hypothetical protein BT69DRAFT_1328329 [Atractiella rhizophila]
MTTRGASEPDDEELSDQDLTERQMKGRLSLKERGPQVKLEFLPDNVTDSIRVTEYAVLVEEGRIDLDADYQRAVVWDDNKQIALIQSLFISAPVPPVLFSRTFKGGRHHYRCIDGKQRLTSICRFLKGEIYLRTGNDNHHWYYKMPANPKTVDKRLQLLPEAERNIFKSRRLGMMFYDHLDAQQERDIFQRIQNGCPLSTAEKLSALAGPYVDFIKSLVKAYYVERRWKERLNLDFHRANEFQIFAEIVYTLLPLLNNVRHISIQRLKIDVLFRSENPTKKVRESVAKSLDRLDALVGLGERGETHKAFLEPKSLAPIELVWLPWIVSRWASYSDGELLEAIQLFRNHINDTYESVRKNSNVTKEIHAYVKSFQKISLKKIYKNDGSLKAVPTKKVKSVAVSNRQNTTFSSSSTPFPTKKNWALIPSSSSEMGHYKLNDMGSHSSTGSSSKLRLDSISTSRSSVEETVITAMMIPEKLERDPKQNPHLSLKQPPTSAPLSTLGTASSAPRSDLKRHWTPEIDEGQKSRKKRRSETMNVKREEQEELIIATVKGRSGKTYAMDSNAIVVDSD